MKLIEYQNMRGGRVVFQEIAKPAAQEWSSALHAVGTLYLLIHFLACFFPCLARNGGGLCPLGGAIPDPRLVSTLVCKYILYSVTYSYRLLK